MSPRLNKKGASRDFSHHSHHSVPEGPSSSSSTSKYSRNSPSTSSRKAQDNSANRSVGIRPPMQTQQQSYPQQVQHNRRRSIVLPPGKNDLEILENLKQIIKNGQHEFYRAIPQPAALASLYLGKIPSSEPTGKSAKPEDTQNATNGAQNAQSATSPTSPVDSDRRPPRLQGKNSWDSRRQSTSAAGEQPELPNGYPVASEAPPASATPESPASTIPGIGGMTRNGQATTGMAETLLSHSGNHENPPNSDDSPTIVATSPQKGPPSPAAPMQDRSRPYDPQPPSHPRNDRQPPRDERDRRDSYSRPFDRNARNGDDGWRGPAQRPYKQSYANQPRQPFVKAEEVPISLSDLDTRGPTASDVLPIPESASSHIHTRNGNNGPSDERARFDDVSSSMAPGRGAPHSDLAGQRLQVDSEQSARPLAPSDSDFTFKPEFPPRTDRDPVFPATTDQGNRPAGLPSDPNRIPSTNKDSRYPARQPEKYNRPGSPGITANNGLPRSYSNRDRDDFRSAPPKGQPHRDYRPTPRDLSRERDYRPAVANNYRPSYEDRPVIDVDEARYDDRHYRRSFSPPTSTELARDRQRQIHDRFPPSPRTGTDVGYDGSRRFSGPPPPSGGAPPRDWYPTQPAPGSYARWEDDPYYNRSGNWDPAPDRGRYDPETPRRGWESRPERDSYRGAPASDDRYMPPPPPPSRDIDRGRQGPPPPPAAHGPGYGPRTRRLESPSSARDGPPLKRARDNEYGPPTGDYYPPPPSTRDSIRRPSDGYPSRGATPPPPSTTSSQFYDRAGPPPSSASTNMSGDRDRDFMSRRDSAMEYIPSSMPPPLPPHSANSYDRPRSPGPPPPSGGGGRAMQSGGGQGGYGRGGYAPRGMRDNRQGYMPPASRP